jgi:hypothetical protein
MMILQRFHKVGLLDQHIIVDMMGIALDGSCCHNHIPGLDGTGLFRRKRRRNAASLAITSVVMR